MAEDPKILTYRSENTEPNHLWMALVETASGTMVVYARAATEELAVAKMEKHLEQEKAKGHVIAAPKKGPARRVH